MTTSLRNILPLALTLSALFACDRKQAEPVEAEKPAQENPDSDQPQVVELTPEATKAAQIQTTRAELKTLSVRLSVPGRVTFTQNGVAKVAARVPGRVADLDVSLGSKVKKGDVLAHLESPELTRTRADYLTAATKARVAESNFRREQELNEKGISSERDMRQAEAEFAAAQADTNAAEGRLHGVGARGGC